MLFPLLFNIVLNVLVSITSKYNKLRHKGHLRSRCLPGAGRAFRPRARPLPARAARGPWAPSKDGGSGIRGGKGRGRASRPGGPERAARVPLVLGPCSSSAHACPPRLFSVGTREPAPLLCPPRGQGRWHLLGASLSPGHQRSKAKGTAFGVLELDQRRLETCRSFG